MSTQPYYDPAVQEALDTQPSLGVVNADTLKKVRASRLLRNADAELSDEVERVDHFVSGVDDNDGRIRVHRCKGAQELSPALYWIHGGGYVLGNPEQDDFRFDRWCQRFGLVGAAVQYRLAPEHPYPAGLEDSYAGLKWLKEMHMPYSSNYSKRAQTPSQYLFLFLRSVQLGGHGDEVARRRRGGDQ